MIWNHSSRHSGQHTKGEPSSLESLGELFARRCRAHPSKTFISPCGSCHLIPRFGFEWGSLRMPDVGNKGLKIIFPNNLPIYHSRKACALCEHVSREPNLTLHREVQRQLLASARGFFFFPFFFFPFPFPEAAQQKAALPSDQPSLSLPFCLPPSLPGLWIAWILESWAPYLISHWEKWILGCRQRWFSVKRSSLQLCVS